MKHEIVKKTLLYRVFSFILTQIISTLVVDFFVHDIFLSWWLSLFTELGAVCLYYIYEHGWKRLIKRIKLRKGMNLFSIKGNGKVSISYNVLEVLGDNKFIIEVD